MNKPIKRITQITLAPEGATINDEFSTDVCIKDEGGGEFITINQEHEIRISIEEWALIREVVDSMVLDIKTNKFNNITNAEL